MGFGTSGEVFFRNDARTAESIQKPTVRLSQGRAFRAPNSKLNKRMDNNAADVAGIGDGGDDAKKQRENLDASEVLYSRRNNRQKEKDEVNNDGKEIQEVAESNNSNKGYSYPRPESGYHYLPPQQTYNYPSAKENLKTSSSNGKTEKLKKNLNNFLNEPQPFSTRPIEKSTEMYVSTIAALEIAKKSVASKVGKSLESQQITTIKPQSKSTAPATSVTRQRGSTTYASSLKAAADTDVVRSRVQSNVNSLVNGNNLKSSTPSYDSQKINTYTMARKPNGGKTKEMPFYTPTIPTVRDIQTTTASFSTSTPIKFSSVTSTTTIAPDTSTKPTNSEIVKHALEMMESLKELDMEDVIPTEAERYMGQRLGLEVPPSSGPSALHSLALYFANGDTNNTKRMTQIANGITSVFLSNKTIAQYESLFPDKKKSSLATTTRPDITSTSTSKYQSDSDNDLEAQHSKHPILSAAGTPQLREIAQVFTHALSAYLQDPEQFRKILSEIRPTEPPNVQFNEIPRFPGENGFVRQESAYNVPRQTANAQKSEDLEIFEYSDVTVPSKVTEEQETTTEYNDIVSTTEPNVFTTIYPETYPPASSKLADKTPASRLYSEKLDRAANSRSVNQFDENLRLSAGEINSNLNSFTVRYNFEENKEDTETDDASYFPEDRGNKSILAPYGFGVKPENSTPINDPYPTSLTDTQAVPLQWGEELTTADPSNEFNAYPTVFSDLLPPFDINGTEVFSIPSVPSNGLELPNEETDEHLQHAQSQSFVASRNTNNIYSEEKRTKSYNDYNVDSKNEGEILFGTTNFGERLTTEIPQTTTQKLRGHFVTKAIYTTSTKLPETTTFDETTTENYKTTLPDTGKFNADSKTTLSYTVFLDPLTINDGLMESLESSVTPSPNTYLPRNERNELSSTEEIVDQSLLTTTHTTAHRRGKSSFATTPLTIRFNDDESHQNSIEPMQKRANEMFGKLNETQVNHLMNVMKKADENKTVRRLILLLIQTCDGDDHNRTLEASRVALLNALIGMDEAEDKNEIKIVSSRREKSIKTTTLSSVPITTYKSPEHERYTSSETVSKELDDSEATVLPFEQTTFYGQSLNIKELTTQDYYYSTTDQETTTETPTTTSFPLTTTSSIIELFESNILTDSKPKFRLKSPSTNLRVNSDSESIRHQKSLGTHQQYHSEASSLEHKKVDARALELLRSLYSLASRWGKKK